MMTLTSKSSASWSDAMTFKLLNICLEVKKAFMNTSFGGFKKSEWKKINIDFNAAYNVGYDTTQIQSKVSDLKKKYVILLDLRSHGFEWDSETKRVIADEDVWAKYLVSHPQARCFKTSSFVFYDQMEALCSPLPQKATIQNDKREEISIMNEIINTSYDNNDNEDGTQTAAAEPSQRSKKKAKLSREVEYQMPKNFAPYLGDSSITSLISSFPHDNTSSSITNASTVR
jgi:hypothetical protein